MAKYVHKTLPHAFKKGEVHNPKGRPKGALAKLVRMTDAKRKELLARHGNISPMDYVYSEMLDETAPRLHRLRCAGELMPYFHRRMPIAIDNGAGGPIGFYSEDQLKLLSPEGLAALQKGLSELAATQAMPGRIIEGMSTNTNEGDD